MVYWFAGQLHETLHLQLASNAPALIYGASVFTTMRVYRQSLEHPLTDWQAHCDRISHSLATFQWPQPDWNSVIAGCRSLINYYPVIRLAILADGRELITGRQLPEQLANQQHQGVTAWIAQGSQYQRSLPAHKTGNYLPCWLAIQSAKAHGARDAILISPSGEWLETSTGNLWGYKSGQWWTPPLKSGLLPGISRARLLRLLGNQVISHQPWTLNLVKEFECLAYSNCVVQLLPIHTVRSQNIKLNYSSTHASLVALRQLFNNLQMCKHDG